MARRNQSKLTEGDKEFVEDLSRKIILRAYLKNSASMPRTLADKFKQMFARKSYKAPVVDILDIVEKQKK